MLPYRLLTLLLLSMLLAAPARAASTYSFAGGAVAGCPLQARVYSCSKLPLVEWNDAMVIGKNYTVNVAGDVAFGYNQGLSMADRSTLTASGNLDIGGIATSLLQVSGATLVAGGQFSMGAQAQTIVADISAASMQLGTGSAVKITGTVNAGGAIAIASSVTIVGPVTGTAVSTSSPVSITGDVNASTSFFLASGGTVKGNIVSPTVATDSPVTITGNVTASRSFTLASGSTMTGNVKSDVVQLLASGVTVNGAIEAATSLRLGSGNVVNGSVVTGELTLEASNSTINGSATVDHATLEWAARVTDTIYCARGSTAGKCDCVSNNSGYEVRSVKTGGNGPYCVGKTQPLDHYVIGHDASASVCAPSSVTITACANAACSATYGGGASVFLQPSKQRIDIGASGVATAAVQMKAATATTLSLASAGGAALPASCRLNGKGTVSNCTLAVGDAALALQVKDVSNAFLGGDAASAVDLVVTALVSKDGTSACVPLFQNVQRNIAFSFGYDNPSTGSLAPRLGGVELKAAPQTLALTFDQNGKAGAKFWYQDAGQLSISAAYVGAESGASGSVLAIAAPASFGVALSALPAPRKAGSTFTATVTALNAAGNAMPNFGREKQAAIVALSGENCKPASPARGFVAPALAPAVDKGSQAFTVGMDEVGSIDVRARLDQGYLGSAYQPTGSTNLLAAPNCSGASGAFVPAYFRLAKDDWTRKTGAGVDQYYADERKIALTLTAMNLRDAATLNYAGAYARDIDLAAADAARKPIASPPGSFLPLATACKHSLCAADFVAGAARWNGGYAFAKVPSPPATLRIRAIEYSAAAQDTPPSSKDAPLDKDEPLLLVRSGRARIASNYIGAGKEIRLPVSVEYWDGKNWLRNFDDSKPLLPASAFSLTTATPGDALNATRVVADLQLAKGYGELRLQPPAGAVGYVNVALNLGTTDTQDNSCVLTKKTTKGAALDFLRSLDTACAAALRDPDARATFGVFSPETRRIIHVREVFR